MDVTLCHMAGKWEDLADGWERLRWARIQAGFERAKDAADSVGVKPVTYRSYERPEEQQGRKPPLPLLRQFAKRYRVSWVWLATGLGAPDSDDNAEGHPLLTSIQERVEAIPADKRDDAIRAALSVLESFRAAS